MLTVAMEGCREKKMGKIDDAQRGEGVGKTYFKILKRKWLCEGRKDAAGTFLIEIFGFFAHSLRFFEVSVNHLALHRLFLGFQPIVLSALPHRQQREGQKIPPKGELRPISC